MQKDFFSFIFSFTFIFIAGIGNIRSNIFIPSGCHISISLSLSLSYLHTYTNMYSTYPISFTHSIPLSHKYTHIKTCIVHLIYSFYTSLTLSQTCIVQILSHLLYLSLSYLNTLFKPLSYT